MYLNHGLFPSGSLKQSFQMLIDTEHVILNPLRPILKIHMLIMLIHESCRNKWKNHLLITLFARPMKQRGLCFTYDQHNGPVVELCEISAGMQFAAKDCGRHNNRSLQSLYQIQY